MTALGLEENRVIVLLNAPFLSKSTTSYLFFAQNPFPNPALALFAGLFNENKIPYLCIDAKLDNLTHEEIAGKIERELNGRKPLLFGITMPNTTLVYEDFELIRFLREKYPLVPVVAGGPHVSALPEHTLETCKDIDVIVRFSGITPILELYDLYSGGNRIKSLSEIRCITYRGEHNKIVSTPLTDNKNTDLGNYVRPRWEDFKVGKHYHIFAAIGCPFRCSYCFNLTNRNFGVKPIEVIIEELRTVVDRFGVKRFTFADATFGFNKEHAKALMERMIAEGFHKKATWDCLTRVTVPEKELCGLMKKAGCHSISLGMESGSDPILKRMHKNITTEDIISGFRTVKESGINAECFLIIGHIGETLEDVKKSIELCVKINPSVLKVGVMTPWPGTEVYELASQGKEGLMLVSDDFSKYDKYFGESLRHNNIDLNKLDALRIEVLLRLYLQNHRYLDLLKYIWRMKFGIAKKAYSMIRRQLSN